MTDKKPRPVDDLLTAIEQLGGTVSRAELLGLLTQLELAVIRRKSKQREEE